jgi:signal recognition particle subunit SEC65
MKEQLIKEIKEACKEAGIKATDTAVLENAVKVVISNQIQAERRFPKIESKSKEIIIKDPNSPASTEQLKLLNDLGYKGDKKLNKIEASILIGSFIGK